MTISISVLYTHGMLNHCARKLGKGVQTHSTSSAPTARVSPFAMLPAVAAGLKLRADGVPAPRAATRCCA